MSEIDARERYYWSKIRQSLKDGNPFLAARILEAADCDLELEDDQSTLLSRSLEERIGRTFTAGCIALGDPAPLDKEHEHE